MSMTAGGRRRAFLAVTAALAWPSLGCTERVPLLSASIAADAAPESEPTDVRSADKPASPDLGTSRDTGPEARCSEFTENVRLDSQAPQVIIALDRSFSMFQHKAGKNWWVWVRQALLGYMENNEGAVEFGYEEFPGRFACDPSACCASRVLVQPFLNSSWRIEDEWRCDGPSCYETTVDSPSGDALGRIRSFYDFQRDPAVDRFVLLVTDGDPSCASNMEECNDAGRQAARMFTQQGVKTIVLPIGEEARNSACLQSVAVMGQTRKAADTDVPWVGDPAQLDAQLAKAMAPVEQRACRFLIRDPVQDRDKLVVTVNFTPLPRDPAHKEGWDFDPGGGPEIQLFGSVCKKLKCAELEGKAVRAEVTCAQCGSNVTCP